MMRAMAPSSSVVGGGCAAFSRDRRDRLRRRLDSTSAPRRAAAVGKDERAEWPRAAGVHGRGSTSGDPAYLGEMEEVHAAFEIPQPDQPDGSPGSAVTRAGGALALEVWHLDDYDEALETEGERAEWFDEALARVLEGAVVDAVEVGLRPDYSGELDRQWLADLLARRLPATVRSLHWGASSGSCFVGVPDIGPLREALPTLEVLRLEAEWHFENAALDIRGLRHLGLNALSAKAIEHLVRLDLSAIEHLELWLYDGENEGAEVPRLEELLRVLAAPLPALRELTLHQCEYGPELLEALPTVPAFGQLNALHLLDATVEGSYLDDACAEALLSERYASIGSIDVTGSFWGRHHEPGGPLLRLMEASEGRIHARQET